MTLPGSGLNGTEFHPGQPGSCNHHPSNEEIWKLQNPFKIKILSHGSRSISARS